MINPVQPVAERGSFHRLSLEHSAFSEREAALVADDDVIT